MIVEWAGGAVDAGAVDTAPHETEAARVPFRPSRTDRLLGVTLDATEQRDLLARVGIETAVAAPGTAILVAAGTKPLSVEAGPGVDVLEAIVPSWRRDLAVEADVIEEIARVRGYETIAPILPHTPMPTYRHSPLEARDAVRETLVGAGLNEVVTYALVPPRMVERFPFRDDGAPDGEPEQRPAGRPVVVTNPLSSQHSVLRQSLLGSLLEVIATNLRYGHPGVAIFEIGKGYGATGEPPTHEWWRLGFALTGPTTPPAWNQGARAYDLDDAKGILEALAIQAGLPAPAWTALTDDPNLHPGRAARIDAGGGMVGRVGELHPAVVEALDIRAEHVVVAEVAIRGLAGGQVAPARVTAPPRHPAVERDLAVIVGTSRPAAEVAASIRRHAGPRLRALALFDIYRGRPLADEEKSLAYRLTLRDDDRTLTDADVDAVVAQVTAGLAGDLGARLRT